MLLDIDHGTYPYVTSSNTIAGQAAGTSIGPSALTMCWASPRPIPRGWARGRFHRQNNEIGQRLGERGHEFGTVTGRKRRAWFDAVLVRQMVETAGIDGIALPSLTPGRL